MQKCFLNNDFQFKSVVFLKKRKSMLDNYREFVLGVTSEPSKDKNKMVDRINEMDEKLNTSHLLTGVIGLSSETGELAEIVKKMLFQGKPVNEENIYHIKRELSDICWYLVQACEGVGTTMEEVIEMNVEKLQARYPGGKFDVHKSENRKENDL